MGDDIRYLGTVGWVESGTRKECVVAIEGQDLFYSNNGTSFAADPADANGGKLANALVAGTAQVFAGAKQQKLYIADPGAAGDAQIRVFTPTSGAASTIADNTATSGTTPDDCPLCCVYRDRLVVAGPSHLWYMSRVCTPTDWNYACDLDDPARAVSGSNSDAGAIGEMITALIPHGDQRLIFGYMNSIWVMRGDPAYGGQVGNLSRDIGILSGTSWCTTPEGFLVFLSRDGIYGMAAEATSRPEPLSREKLPDELLGLTTADYLTMGYSINEGGIHISQTPTSGTGKHWFFDWRTKAFWKDVLPAESQPTYQTQYAVNQTSQRELLFGTRGGYVLKLDDDTESDNDSATSTQAIHSYVLLGPFFPGGSSYHQARLNEIYAVLDESSKDVDWEVLVGDTAEEAVQASASVTGTWTAGRNTSDHPMVVGSAIVIKLSSSGRWALDHVMARVAKFGKVLMI
jgi:hypothetical protein